MYNYVALLTMQSW